MKQLLLALTFFGLSGCATTDKFDEKCKSWLGKPTESLISSWGVPTKDYEVNKDTKLIEYFFNNGTALVPIGYGYSSVDYSCKTTFTSKAGVITEYKWNGNSCKSD